MKIDALTIYLWQLADSIHHASLSFWIIGTILGIVFMILSLIAKSNAADAAIDAARYSGSDNKKELAKVQEETKWAALTGKVSYRLMIVGILGMLTRTLAPSSDTIAMMVVIPAIVDSKIVQQDLPELYNAAVGALKDSLKQ